jgi:hypothetical protein
MKLPIPGKYIAVCNAWVILSLGAGVLGGLKGALALVAMLGALATLFAALVTAQALWGAIWKGFGPRKAPTAGPEFSIKGRAAVEGLKRLAQEPIPEPQMRWDTQSAMTGQPSPYSDRSY